MDLTQLANLGEFIGGIAVLATLAYLALQVRQNTSTLQSAAIQTVISDYRSRHIASLMSDADLMSIFVRGLQGLDRLEPAERPRFFFVLLDVVLQAQTVMELHHRGTLSLADYEVWIEGIAGYLRAPGARECWEDFKWGVDPEIAEALSSRLTQAPDGPSILHMQCIQVAGEAALGSNR